MSIPNWYSFTRQIMSRNEQCTDAATEAQKCWIAVKKTSNQVQETDKEDQIVMLPHKPATKVKRPGQATHKDVLQNKNCPNVNIVNMWPQKPSFSDESFKKPATMHKQKYTKHQNKLFIMTSNVKKLRNLCIMARNVHQTNVLIGSQ